MTDKFLTLFYLILTKTCYTALAKVENIMYNALCIDSPLSFNQMALLADITLQTTELERQIL